MYEYYADIKSIYDGDTVRADIDLGFGVKLENQPLRFYGINAPEITGELKNEGLISRDKLREKILGKRVIIRTYKDSKEKYGRYLATVILDGVIINDWLVENKLAVKMDY